MIISNSKSQQIKIDVKVQKTPIPSEYIIPTGTIEITENGEYDVKNYETAEVNVSGGSTSLVLPDGIAFGSSLFSELPEWIENADTSELTSMCCMFYWCNMLQTINLNNWDTSNVEDMSSMFEYCGVNELDLSNFDVSNVTDMTAMFGHCSSLQTINFNNWNPSSVEDMWGMFENCSSLSNETLNDILLICINATAYEGTKTLEEIGLSSSQATTCQGLSNYQAFLDAGWTTGY